MQNNQASFLKTDDNKVINKNCIRWVKKLVIVQKCAQKVMDVIKLIKLHIEYVN